MQKVLAIVGVLGFLIVVGTETASAVAPRGDCGCTEHPPTCDPEKTFELSAHEIDGQGRHGDDGIRIKVASEGKYITDEDGGTWHCEKGDCHHTGVYVLVRNEGVRNLTGFENYMG